MSLISFKPTTPSLRKTVKVNKTYLFKGRPEKLLTESQQPSSGRNNTGKITIRHRSGGAKKKYRVINFKRNTMDILGTVERLEYDPNRTAFIALISYEDKPKEYIIAPTDLKAGDTVMSSEKTDIKIGNSMKLKNIAAGTSIHNIELKPGAGAKLCRSAGTFAQVLGSNESYIMVKLTSKETRLISGECMATIGVVSNSDNKNKKIGKAGIKRHLGIKPTVRGVAMNPVDHPHGGGEGRTSGGRHPTSPWGLKTKGKKTRTNKRTTKFIISKGSKK
ncbi:MAG: 50S ribosomal protein L2 [Alphaproteobacteria bacterium]|jgi:large subunit ribosomal protein L2|tara:strand:+ start:5333 stop:6160 length:828 start_codon:yes stop_codon:yes gene_type:complete